MPNENNNIKIKSIMSLIYQSLGIAGIIITILAVPVKMRFTYVEARQEETIKALNKHYEDHKELEKKIPNETVLETQYENITEKLDILANELEKCRETDKEFREQLYEYFKNR